MTLAMVIGASAIWANKAADGDGICIVISPNSLVLSKDTASVTVHSNLPIGLVDCDSLLLEGVPPVLTKADNLGHLVAKFDEEAIKALVQPGEATLTLTGILADGTDFAASDSITVRE
jgi:hypothetical protein